MRLIQAALALLALPLFLTSCASDSGGEVSRGDGNIPWNRPEKWEGPGILGSQMGQGR